MVQSTVIVVHGRDGLFSYSDTIVFARLNEESRPLMETTLKHLGVSACVCIIYVNVDIHVCTRYSSLVPTVTLSCLPKS